MGKTYRKQRPQFNGIRVEKIVKDGSRQYNSIHCEHNHGCNICQGNRHHKNVKRKMKYSSEEDYVK